MYNETVNLWFYQFQPIKATKFTRNYTLKDGDCSKSMIFIITVFQIQVLLPFLNPIKIHEQIEGIFKSYAMAQSAYSELFLFRYDMLLKMKGLFW